MKECAREVKVSELQVREAAAVGGVSYVGAENEGPVCCVGGASVGFVVGCFWLCATVDGKTGGNESTRLLFDKHLASENYVQSFNVGFGDGDK